MGMGGGSSSERDECVLSHFVVLKQVLMTRVMPAMIYLCYVNE